MFKQYFRPLLILCVLIFSVAYYFNEQNRTDNEIRSDIGRHIQLIHISNEISSYAKRAEGHILLYLTLGQIKDREKVTKRLATLHEYILKLDPLLDIKEARDIYNQLHENHDLLSEYITQTLQQYDVQHYQMFSDEAGIKNITELHAASSKIRKLGVKLVELSTQSLDAKKEDIHKENQLKYQALIIFTVVTFLFLIVITYQSGKISLTEQVADSLSKLSYLDALTGVGNRRYFDDELDKEWRRSIRSYSSFSLLFIDIDYFKSYNDTYGHTNGDKCLSQVAQSLKHCLRRPSDIIARYGGEEFVAILPETNHPEKLAEFCRETIEALSIPNEKSPLNGIVTISIGVGTISPTSSDSRDAFIRSVDNALYKAKESGRNRVVSI